MFQRQQALRQPFLVVAGFDRQARLRNHRAAVQFGSDEMHAGAVLGLLVSGRLQWDGQAPRFDGRPLLAPLRLSDDGLQP